MQRLSRIVRKRRRRTSSIDSVCCRKVYYFFAGLAAATDRKVSMERAQGNQRDDGRVKRLTQPASRDKQSKKTGSGAEGVAVDALHEAKSIETLCHYY